MDEHRIETVTMCTRTRMGTGTRTGSGRAEERRKSAKKPYKSCRRRDVETGETWVDRKQRRQEKAGSIAANPDNLENRKEAGGGGAKCTKDSSKNCTSRESVSPLSRLVRGFRNKWH